MIRLVTANVQHALVDGAHVDLERLGHALAGLDADVVALQEVDHRQQRSGGTDQTRVLAGALGMSRYRFLPAVQGPLDPPWRRRRAPERPAKHAPGLPGYGIALLSRLPVRAWHPMRLPGLNVPGLPPLGVDEPRAALAAVVTTPDGPLTVVTTHLSQKDPWKRVQLRRLRRRLRHAPRPLVLLGDLNTRGDLPARRTGWRELVHVPTYPAARPWLRIDHVLVDGDLRAGGPASARDLGVSDHRAVVVDVVLTSAPRDERRAR
ncbi:endonuclease/exonuclease/phosphatase family protein [Isoptericola cucumis]|uniref:Endonuclease/exonuclease/phosphatase n=1 Tax=Isoptericola cucumis TaxID=1776856 RepID=A0ABQ2B8X0_9MICO|nr:endonuclease/exonuclease/phosphatase family protein [Isoptericola cucumis]GGI10505.1 endonuclease/exonuclease/phosphatase [Isoptericola cucumis]